MKDRVKLDKLLNIIGDLLKIEGNEWLIDGLLEKINEASPMEDIAKHSIIQNIHEYCVEQKIEKQATDFYNSFPIEEIKLQLMQDYKKMEHERRRDDFENFSICIYQQIENITNFLFDNKVSKIWNTEKNKIAIKSFFDSNQRKYVKPKNGGTSLEKLIFQSADSSKWFANRKFRAVLFFFYYRKEITRDDFQFNSIYFTHQEIYQMRNQNHRGGNPTEYQQKTLNKIKGNEAKYYFKFYGFLQDFMSQIEYSLGKTKIDIKQNKKTKKKDKSANTLGESNPQLVKLLEQLKKNE